MCIRDRYGSGSNSAAEFMVVATSDGSRVSIHSIDDDVFCEKIADKMRLQARFKTSSRKVKGEKTGEYNFWSVVSLIVNSMTSDKQEDISEAIIDTIKKKVKSLFSSVINKVKSFISKGVNSLMKFLGAEPDVSFKKDIKF